MPERVAIISDTHLGFEDANKQELMQFLENEVPQLNLDELVLNGDILDLWRGSIESVMAEHSDFLDILKSIDETKTNVRIIAGNHDWRWVESERSDEYLPPEPWVVQREWEFSSGDVDFTINHGHEYDYANANPISNRGLCLTDDQQAGTISDLYSNAISGTALDVAFLSREPAFARLNLGTLSNLADPNQLSRSEFSSRVERIEDRAIRRNDNHIIIGHTHVPRERDNLTNTGSWTGDSNQYALVDGGDISVIEF